MDYSPVKAERAHSDADLPAHAVVGTDLAQAARDSRPAGKADAQHDLILAIKALAWEDREQ